MISIDELRKLADERLSETEALAKAGRFHGGNYLCGYAVELSLKICICEALRWEGFPFTKKEFEGLASFKTHDLEMLLHLSGKEERVVPPDSEHWSFVIENWDPEVRYKPIDPVMDEHIVWQMIKSVRTLQEIL